MKINTDRVRPFGMRLSCVDPPAGQDGEGLILPPGARGLNCGIVVHVGWEASAFRSFVGLNEKADLKGGDVVWYMTEIATLKDLKIVDMESIVAYESHGEETSGARETLH